MHTKKRTNCKLKCFNFTQETDETSHTLKYYFQRNYYLDEDFLPERILNTTNLLCFKDYIQTHVPGIPKIINVHPVITI